MGAIEFGAEITKESQFVEIQDGEYEFTVDSIERGKFNGSEKTPACNKMIVNMKIALPDGATGALHEDFILWDTMEWKLSEFFISIGMKKKGEPMPACNWMTEIPGRKGRCRIVQVPGTKDPTKKFARIDKFLEPQQHNWSGGF